MNIVAKKTRSRGRDVIESVETYDEDTGKFAYYHRQIRYHKGGEAEIGDWHRIKATDYAAETSPQITYDHHPCG